MAKLGASSYWIDLGERTVRSFAQGVLVGLGVTAASTPVTHLPWQAALELGAAQAVVCFLMGLAGLKFGDKQTASFLPPPAQTPLMMSALFHKE